MPKLTYTPEGVEPIEFDFDFDRIMSPERVAIERATGLGWTDCCARFFNQDTAVVDAFLHVLMKRSRPTLKMGELVWCGAEIDTDVNDAEALAFVEQHDPGDPDEAAEAERLRPRIAHLLEVDASDPVVEG